MGIVDGGVSGVGYSCGCEWRSDGNHQFCGDKGHKKKECGCYRAGPHQSVCNKHTLLAVGVVALFAAVIVGATLIFT